MKLIATAQTFSRNDLWTEYEIYKHGDRYRVSEQENGLGWGILCDAEEPTRRWASVQEVKELLTLDTRDAGTVDIADEDECESILNL